jgi:hypothetical protein
VVHGLVIKGYQLIFISRGLVDEFRTFHLFVPGSLVGIKDIDFVGRSEAETP